MQLLLLVSFTHTLSAQAEILLQTPALITAMFNLCIARNWLSATLSILRFSQYLTQAVSPGAVESRWSQLPGVSEEQSKEFNSGDMEEVLARLPGKEDVQKAVKSWGKLDIVDATYKGKTG
jgi:translocation protein SEC63